MNIDRQKITCGIYLQDNTLIIVTDEEKGSPNYEYNVFKTTDQLKVVWQIRPEDSPLKKKISSSFFPDGYPFSGLCRQAITGPREWVSMAGQEPPAKPEYTHYQEGDTILTWRWDSYIYTIDIETGRAEVLEFSK